MATGNLSLAAPVELADAMKAGFQDAMTRIADVALNAKATLVDQIPSETWAGWDQTNEHPNVIDADGVDGYEEDGIAEPAAA